MTHDTSYKGESISFWRDSTQIPNFKTLDENLKVDVAIVGGGITGITAAYLLAKQSKDVALIESDALLSGTTGYTTAKVTAQHGLIYNELIEKFGKEQAQLYYQAQNEGLNFIEQQIRDLYIDCDFRKETAYLYTNSIEKLDKLKKETRAYETLNIPHHYTEEIPLKLPIEAALAMEDQANFHPLKYLRRLIDECIKHKVSIYEQTTAIDVEYHKHPTILTKNGKRIVCKYIIIASHYPFYDGEGYYPMRMYAERSYAVAALTKQTYPGGMYINVESPARSIRTTTYNNRPLWIFVGENHKTGQGKETSKHFEALKQFAKQYFGPIDIQYEWSAQDLTTLDQLPYIGPITKSEKNILIATGFRKWGMTNGTIAAKILVDYILDKDNPYKTLFTPSRFKINPSLFNFAKSNLDVAKHLVKGRIQPTIPIEAINHLKRDESMISRIDGKRVGIYKDQTGEIHIVKITCTHLGCPLEWNEGERSWDCPCHGSRFSYHGEVIEGPAKKSLEKIDFKK